MSRPPPSSTSEFDARVGRLLADPLAVARQAAPAGERVIGYAGAEGPVELIWAAGALPVRLRGPCEGGTARADEFLESAFAPELRAVAEQWLSGALDFVEAVIFPRSNDSAQRLYYYLCELQRRGLCGGPRPLLFDVASIARDSSYEHTLASVRLLALSLGVAEAELAQALQRVAVRDALLARLVALRLESSPVLGSAAHRALRAADCDHTEAFDRAFSSWLDQAPRLQSGCRRWLLAGSASPDERLHRAVEAAGATIVRDLVETERASAAGSDPFETIARRSHGARSPAQRMLASADWLSGQARAAHADGVLLWLIEEDEALPWEVAGQARALETAGIPALALTRQRWLADPAALQAITEFVRASGGTR